VPSPNCKEFTVREEIVALDETLRLIVVIEDANKEPVLIWSELMNTGRTGFKFNPLTVDVRDDCKDAEDMYPAVPRPPTVD
jgi:hypothetical protein